MEVVNKLKDKKEFPYLLRFMDTAKLLDFLVSESLHFTRLDNFEDKSEAISRKQLAKLFEHDISIPETLKKELPLLDRQQRYFATCWFSGKRESIGMWNLYSNTSSIALKIPFSVFNSVWSKEPLVSFDDSVIDWVDRIYVDKIYYKDYFSFADVDNFKQETRVIGFQKDVSYEHEKEVRILIKAKGIVEGVNKASRYRDAPLPFIKAKLNNIKTHKMELLFHPLMPHWHKQNIKDLLKKYGYKNIKCKDSEVTTLLNPIFKK